MTCLEFFALNEYADFVLYVYTYYKKVTSQENVTFSHLFFRQSALCKKFAFLLIFFATVFNFKFSNSLKYAINLIISAKSLLKIVIQLVHYTFYTMPLHHQRKFVLFADVYMFLQQIPAGQIWHSLILVLLYFEYQIVGILDIFSNFLC